MISRGEKRVSAVTEAVYQLFGFCLFVCFLMFKKKSDKKKVKKKKKREEWEEKEKFQLDLSVTVWKKTPL